MSFKKQNYMIGIGIFFSLMALSAASAFAATLVWNPVPDAEGYRVHWGTSKGDYTNSVDAGLVTRFHLEKLSLADNTTYFITVTAYNSAGQSSYAAPVIYSPGDNTPPLPPKNPWIE